MSIGQMKFKNYLWPRNPRDISVTVENDVVDVSLPNSGSIFQKFGRKKRIVSGSGEFVGENCFKQFKSFFNLFKSSVKESGYLAIPNVDPFLAIFKSLKLKGDPSPNLVTYSFLFWEDIENIYEREINVKISYHIAEKNETLWIIALKYKLKVEDLLVLNSFIKDPNEALEEGRRIALC